MVEIACWTVKGEQKRVDVDVFIVFEVGRELSLPEYVREHEEKKFVRALRRLSARDFPTVARDFYRILKGIPVEKKVAIIPSGGIVIHVMWAAFLGLHRDLVVGQWNGSDYDWFLLDQELKDFFLEEDLTSSEA